jgi:hypothetical protein
MSFTRRWRDPFSPWGEGARRVVSKTRFQREDAPPARRADEGAFFTVRKKVAPHQFGQMTYDRAIKRVLAARDAHAAVSHGLTSSPQRGEAAVGRGDFPFGLARAVRGRKAC